MALHVIAATGTRSLLLQEEAFGGGVWRVNRRGFAGLDLPQQHLATEGEVGALSRPVEDSALLSTMVGVFASSRDFRVGLHWVKRTTNFDQRFVGALRFANDTFYRVRADDIVAAELHYRQLPWSADGGDQTTSDAGCAANKVGEGWRLRETINNLQGSLRDTVQSWPVNGSPAQPLPTGLLGLDVTEIVRGWHRDARPMGIHLQGHLLLLPAMPRLDRTGLQSVPLFPNRRRRTHWVRDGRWRVGDNRFEYRCSAQLTGFSILMQTRG
jgi:hypothetical protein